MKSCKNIYIKNKLNFDEFFSRYIYRVKIFISDLIIIKLVIKFIY